MGDIWYVVMTIIAVAPAPGRLPGDVVWAGLVTAAPDINHCIALAEAIGDRVEQTAGPALAPVMACAQLPEAVAARIISVPS